MFKKRAVSQGRKKYLLDNKVDLIILRKVKNLEKKRLSKEDRYIVNLIKTQLEKNWRKYLITSLNKISKRYKK